MAHHNEIGKKGESLAQDYLIKKGYRILETNWRYGHKEIDIIAFKSDIIVMVEVKLRSSDQFGDPEEAVSILKQQHLIKAADSFMQEFDQDFEVRFDIISIIKNNAKEIIRHIEEAFIPTLE